jgi:hypothetical protein
LRGTDWGTQPGFRAFVPPPACAKGHKPRRGDLFIETATHHASFCFSAARRAGNSTGGARAAPLKNKKKEAVAPLVL